MDENLCFSRTEKGREELLGSHRALKLRPRQVLFLINDSISVAELKEKLPTCLELENILERLREEGFIDQVKSTEAPHKADPDMSAEPPPEDAKLLDDMRQYSGF
ncbi:MAG: hypothetical protein CO125_06650 [Hydrogenophilales bacterium CG_4_9_14_3_um_filter_59_35]|nr:MAG: hypothetical protein COW70_07605 [Hydrogenophilales bacterium CG18_big_fil_WC_8_21_14_2_50_58_12]PIY02011.1 MAG: hypothetical protein COZ23_00210 [Hydrogenophilales bacterium CG_4_10_14_3_um_filter_58_23]PJB06642.1 MAG: hypothetical protein CO125_06650 [Hydrogenophilales bacterium CG_4_9_14_3_um_filter_59_35]